MLIHENRACYKGLDVLIINENLVDLKLNETDKQRIILHLLNLATKEERIKDREQYLQAVLEREEKSSTSLGYLVAIPHGKSDAVCEPFLVFARCEDAVLWNDKPVKMVFLIGVPESNADDLHLKILGNISRHLIDDEYRQRLLLSENKSEIIKILNSNI